MIGVLMESPNSRRVASNDFSPAFKGRKRPKGPKLTHGSLSSLTSFWSFWSLVP